MTTKDVTTRQAIEYLPATITTEQAMFLLKSIWPKAPDADVLKAAILCRQYGLNPLMRQVYLIQFDKDWAIVLGIKATRQIAQQALKKRGIRYSYADGPRVMTEDEQVRTFGKADKTKLWAITVLRDNQGGTFPGYGSWPTDKKPYGLDKGNSEFNMAFIRSERNALDKLAPGELPDIEVGDDTYIEGDFKLALEKGKEQFSEQVEKDKELWDGKTESKSALATPQAPSKPAAEVAGSNPPSPSKGKGVKSGNPTIPEFKTAVELFNFALGHGVALETIKAKTGYASPADVVDLKASVKALYP